MIQQSSFYVYNLKEIKSEFQKKSISPCWLKQYSQEPRYENNVDVHQQINAWGIFHRRTHTNTEIGEGGRKGGGEREKKEGER